MNNYDTSIYDKLPITVLIYEIVRDERGVFQDYRIAYANEAFAKDYREIYGKEDFLGAQLKRDHLVDEYTLFMMESFQTGKPQSFSTYVPHANLHVHMEPLTDLPEEYLGFFITNIEDFEEQEDRVHFLRVISQMNNNACLLKRHEDGALSTIYATPSFCDMMGYRSRDEAMQKLNEEGFFGSIHEDDRKLVKDLLVNRIGADGARDLTIRKININGDIVWCNVHYAFIEDYEEQYIYCTYANVTGLKKYELQLKSIYTGLGNNLYQTEGTTYLRLRANLSTDVIEEVNGEILFFDDSEGSSYTEKLLARSRYLPIERDQEEFLDIFSVRSLTKSYMDGRVTESRILYSSFLDETVSYVKCIANVTQHPLTGDIVAFFTEEKCNPEKLADTLQEKILAKQFDLVAYIARDRYNVAIGDRSLIQNANIFPKEKEGIYSEYLNEQIIPALKDEEEYRQEIRDAMDLRNVFNELKTREPYSVDIEVDMGDGTYYKRFDFYSVDPESEYCIVLKSDTTQLRLEQRRQEENARELEYSKQELTDANDIIADAGFGMWHIFLEDGQAPRMRGNAKMMDLLGIQNTDLTEEEVYDFWYSRIEQEAIPSVEKSVGEMLEGKLSENTYRWNHPKEGMIYVRCGGAAKAQDGNKTLLRGYHSNVTDIVREEMTQKEALSTALAAAEHANRAKTTFLNNMSHDIRTPMNAIVGFTALAASHIENRGLVEDYLSKISVSSQHLLSLINDVLDMSRIESGKMALDETEVKLPELIHDLRTIIHPNISAKQLELFIDTQDVVNEEIITDKLRLNQVFLNILSNAIKFTPTGGAISFRVIEKPSLPDGFTTFEFHIKDTGIGMSKEFQKTIFEAFTREKTSTVSGIQGTGLGMAITKSIVDMMGGSIYVDSEVGKGTEFTVSIPCKLRTTPTSFEQIPELNGLRALVADDDTHTCLSICAMLRKIGMRPDWTNYGKEAVVRAKEAMDQGDSFQTYIIDWQMPDLNGIETVRRIREIIGDETPIIILTAYDWGDIEEEARKAGVTAFCSKPLFMSELRNVLAQPFRKEQEELVQEEETADFTGKRILLAEDNEMNQMIADAILKEYGFEMDIASDGVEAVRLLREAPAETYDVILMDIQMPNMDGYEAARIIRRSDDEKKANIPIVAVTANAFEEDRKLALEAGMNGHLAKPYDIPKMLGTLRSLLFKEE